MPLNNQIKIFLQPLESHKDLDVISFFPLLFCLLTEICCVMLLVVFLAYFQVWAFFLIYGMLHGCKLSTPLTDDNIQYVALIHKLCYLSNACWLIKTLCWAGYKSAKLVGLEWDSSNAIITEIQSRVPDKIEDHLLQNQLIYLNKVYPLWCLSRYKFTHLIAVTVNTSTAPIKGRITPFWTSQESRYRVSWLMNHLETD